MNKNKKNMQVFVVVVAVCFNMLLTLNLASLGNWLPALKK